MSMTGNSSVEVKEYQLSDWKKINKKKKEKKKITNFRK